MISHSCFQYTVLIYIVLEVWKEGTSPFGEFHVQFHGLPCCSGQVTEHKTAEVQLQILLLANFLLLDALPANDFCLLNISGFRLLRVATTKNCQVLL